VSSLNFEENSTNYSLDEEETVNAVLHRSSQKSYLILTSYYGKMLIYDHDYKLKLYEYKSHFSAIGIWKNDIIILGNGDEIVFFNLSSLSVIHSIKSEAKPYYSINHIDHYRHSNCILIIGKETFLWG
jgi:hypothetical protein